MEHIRPAVIEDLSRIAEMFVFNYRLNFYPIFRNDDFYFGELQVQGLMEDFRSRIDRIWVFDDGVIKGFVQVMENKVEKLFVEPAFQGQSIGALLLRFAVEQLGAKELWALDQNTRAIRFYERNGFCMSGEKIAEEGTEAYLVQMIRK